MAKDDYFVIAYRILAYLYECLKESTPVNLEYLQPETKPFPIGISYWDYIWRWLFKEGYVEGVTLIPIIGDLNESVRIEENVCITPDGIAFLQENSTMQKAKNFLKTLKELVPGV